MLGKPKKKPSKTALRNKCDILASKYYRALTPYCELNGLDRIACSGSLSWAHIFTRSIIHMRYEPYNHLILCFAHHKYYTHNPIDWVRVLEQHYPERLALAEQNRYEYSKLNYEDWIERFSTAQ